MKNAKCEMRNDDKWKMSNDKWKMENAKCKMQNAKWKIINENAQKLHQKSTEFKKTERISKNLSKKLFKSSQNKKNFTEYKKILQNIQKKKLCPNPKNLKNFKIRETSAKIPKI